MRSKLNKCIISLVLLSYFIPWLGLPIHLFENGYQQDCPACHDNTIPSDNSLLSQSYSPDQPCDNPDHRQHNHPVHDHQNCSLCSFLNNHFISMPGIVAGFSSITFERFVISRSIHSSFFETLSQSIRAPPIL